MKTSTAIVLSLSLLVITGCSDGNSKFKGEFLAGCMNSGSSQPYCSCALEKLEVQYSPAELSAMNDTGKLPKNFANVINAIKKVCQL